MLRYINPKEAERERGESHERDTVSLTGKWTRKETAGSGRRKIQKMWPLHRSNTSSPQALAQASIKYLSLNNNWHNNIEIIVTSTNSTKQLTATMKLSTVAAIITISSSVLSMPAVLAGSKAGKIEKSSKQAKTKAAKNMSRSSSLSYGSGSYSTSFPTSAPTLSPSMYTPIPTERTTPVRNWSSATLSNDALDKGGRDKS